MKPQDEPSPPQSPLPLALLISEAVYRLVVLIERLLRGTNRYLIRPLRLQLRCLFW